MQVRHTLWVFVAAALLAACDSPLETNPTAQIPADDALRTGADIRLAVRGIYDALQEDELYNRDLVAYPELYADNLRFTGTFTTDGQVGNRNISPTNSAIHDAWLRMYEVISRANYVLDAIPEAEAIEEEESDQYEGEALFLRALAHFNAVRYWGDVPLVLEPVRVVTGESQLSRTAAGDVYAQIEADLAKAVDLLEGFSAQGRATSGAAQALLARVYLEQGKWAQAVSAATAVIEEYGYELEASYADIFATKNSDEAIFELQYSINDDNSLAFWFFPQALGGRRGFAPTDALYDAYEPGDVRRDVSIAIHDNDGEELLFATKYHRIANGDDNVPVIRLAEMYLIRAEANARLGTSPAVVRGDIDVIRNRAGLPDLPTSITAEEDLISAVLQERRLEFAFEGHRFFDLRRTGRAEDVLGIPASRLLFPIPQQEIDVNENLRQNAGYN